MTVSQKKENTKRQVPLYAKVGWAVAWVTMLVVATMMLRNCATSVIYGSKTAKVDVDRVYQTGLADGTNGKAPALPAAAVENPVLRKSYNKGYRDGLDHYRQAGAGQSRP